MQVDELLKQSQTIVAQAKGLSVPGEMASAQRNLLLSLDLRVEGMTKLAALLPSALGGQAKQASAKIAGDMEIFLASDVIYSQRVVPLIQQTLASNGVHGLSTAPSVFLPNVGWLEPSTVASRLTGQASSSSAERPRTRHPRQRADQHERRHHRAAARTGAQPCQRRRQPDVHRDRGKRRRKPGDERQA